MKIALILPWRINVFFFYEFNVKEISGERLVSLTSDAKYVFLTFRAPRFAGPRIVGPR